VVENEATHPREAAPKMTERAVPVWHHIFVHGALTESQYILVTQAAVEYKQPEVLDGYDYYLLLPKKMKRYFAHHF